MTRGKVGVEINVDVTIHDAIVRVLGSRDEFDQDLDFDAVSFINQRFPDADSLDNAQQYADMLREELTKADNEIDTLVRNHVLSLSKAKEDLKEAQDAIHELKERSTAIRNRAEESEKTVKSVSRDIMLLDTAKRNVELTVTTLKRLVMMVNACEQLVELAGSREYAQTPALIISIKDLEGAFDDIKHIPRVDELLKHKSRIFNDLRLQIQEDFDVRVMINSPELQDKSVSSGPRIISSKEDVMKIDFSGAAQAADSLGDEVRREIINKYCLLILEDYKKQFSPPSGVLAPLEHYEKRLQWLTKALKEFTDKHASIFPPEWIVNGELCMHFCHATRQHFIDLLSSPTAPQVRVRAESDSQAGSPPDPAELMVTVLVKSIELENDMQRRFDKVRKKLGLNTDHVLEYQGVISSCFEPYLGQWVQLEERHLSEMISSIKAAGAKADELIGAISGEPTGDSLDTDPPLVYTSAVTLFAKMRNLLQRCRQFNTGKAMADLFDVFRRTVGMYIDTVLRPRLPSGKHINSANEESIKTSCAIVGSLDYCLKMTPHLHKNCMSILDRQIDVSVSREIQKLAETRELAEDTVVLCVLGGDVRNALQTIAHLDWWSCESVSGVSPHITKLRSALTKSIATLGESLTESHYRVALEHIALKIISHVCDNIYSAKPISEAGAQQLLVDVGEVKTSLMDIPSQACSTKKVLSSYSHVVNRGLYRLECTLKALSSPASCDKLSLKSVLDALDPELASSAPGALDKEVDRIFALRKGPTGSATMHAIAPMAALLSNSQETESPAVPDNSPSSNSTSKAKPDLKTEMNRIGASIMKSKLFASGNSSK
jgi:hypothetical protein